MTIIKRTIAKICRKTRRFCSTPNKTSLPRDYRSTLGLTRKNRHLPRVLNKVRNLQKN